MKKVKIDYISELTGSGKTEYFIEKVCNSTDYFLIVTPNRILCDEIFTRFFLKNKDEEVINIHQRIFDNPSNELKNHINSKEKRVIITTQASFMMGIKLTDKLKDWNLIMDEEMSLFKEHEINVTFFSKDIIEKSVDITEYDDKFYLVHAKNSLMWINLLTKSVKDSFIYSHDYKTLVDYILNDKFITLITKDHYYKFINKDLDQNAKTFSKFYAISILNTEIFNKFKNTLIISSFFEQTITFKLLQKLNCQLNKIQINVLFDRHPHTNTINIHYYLSHNWSTYLRKIKVSRQKTLEMLIYEKIISHIGNEEFLYNANISFRKMIKKGTLAGSTHGINKYKQYKNLVYLPSLNATSSIVKVLNNFSLSRKEIDFARNVLTAYQFVSRGAVRDIANEKEINIHVVDRRTAEFLKTVFKDAKIHFHDTDQLLEIENVKKKKIPNNVKSFMCRVKKRLENKENVRPKTLEKYKNYIELYYK